MGVCSVKKGAVNYKPVFAFKYYISNIIYAKERPDIYLILVYVSIIR